MIHRFQVLKGKRILLIGHTGFKGSWLAIWLSQLGAEVHGYALPPTPGTESNYEYSKVRHLLTSETLADIHDRPVLRNMILSLQPQAIIHLAYRNGILDSYHAPHDAFDTNVLGTANVLDILREIRSPCAVLCVTTDRSYENNASLTSSQMTDILNGHDPYSASKGAAEILIAAYRRAYFLPTATEAHNIQLASARAGCVIGGGDWTSDCFVVDLVKNMLDNRQVEFNNPQVTRPWQHVLEPLSGYLMLVAAMLSRPSPVWSDSWSFGPPPGNDVTAKRFAETFVNAWCPGNPTERGDSKGNHTGALLKPGTEKTNNALEWSPRWSWEVAVLRTARWYRQVCSANADARTLCLNDIDAFTVS
jgi:CDP-glucose 4,6-dehydratase